MIGAFFRCKYIIAVVFKGGYTSKNGGQFILVPILPLCDHHQFSAEPEPIEPLFYKGLGYGKVRVLRGIAQDQVKARLI